MNTFKNFLLIMMPVFLIYQNAPAQVTPDGSAINLNTPDIKSGIPLMEALSKRKSTRDFKEEKLSFGHLSGLLWAANGVNREDGKRTAPSAVNRHMVDIYVVLEEGIYLYDPENSRLVQLTAGDHRQAAGMQEFVSTAPFNLVYVADVRRMDGASVTVADDELFHWACVEAGHMAQNVYLYCASEGLGAVTRVLIDNDKFGGLIHARPGQKVISAQTVGYPK